MFGLSSMIYSRWKLKSFDIETNNGSEDGIETSSLELERSIMVAEPTKSQDGGERNRR